MQTHSRTTAAYRVIQVDADNRAVLIETCPTYDAADARMYAYQTDPNKLDRRTTAYGLYDPERNRPTEWIRLYDDAPDRQA